MAIKGTHLSEETKAKISRTRKERSQGGWAPVSDLTRQRMSDAKKGRPLSPEHKAVVGCKKGYKQSEEHKKNRGASLSRTNAAKRAAKDTFKEPTD